MAAQDGLTFEGTFNNVSSGKFKDNTSNAIIEQFMRDLVTAIKESYLNRIDDMIDEDDMSSDSDTKVPTQQSVKAYADNIAATLNHFKGLYASSGALIAAHPTAAPGDWAQVDTGIGSNVQAWYWDDDDEEWQQLEAGVSVPDATDSVKGIVELAIQSEVNAGTDTTRAVTPAIIKNRDGDVSALTDAGSIAITSDKHTLSSSQTAISWSYTFTGDEMKILITLSVTDAEYTFPNGTLCVFDGDSTGNNIMDLFGVSGDKYLLIVTKFGSNYVAVCKNIGQ